MFPSQLITTNTRYSEHHGIIRKNRHKNPTARSIDHGFHKNTTKQQQTLNIASRFHLAARQLVTKPRIWVGYEASPGGTIIIAMRFLGKDLETSKNSVKRRGVHEILVTIRQYTLDTIKITRKQLPLPGILAPIEILTLLSHLLSLASNTHHDSFPLCLLHEPEPLHSHTQNSLHFSRSIFLSFSLLSQD